MKDVISKKKKMVTVMKTSQAKEMKVKVNLRMSLRPVDRGLEEVRDDDYIDSGDEYKD